MTKFVAGVVAVACGLVFFSGTTDILALGLSGLLGIASLAVIIK